MPRATAGQTLRVLPSGSGRDCAAPWAWRVPHAAAPADARQRRGVGAPSVGARRGSLCWCGCRDASRGPEAPLGPQPQQARPPRAGGQVTSPKVGGMPALSLGSLLPKSGTVPTLSRCCFQRRQPGWEEGGQGPGSAQGGDGMRLAVAVSILHTAPRGPFGLWEAGSAAPGDARGC